jgi:hypothetical protein
MAGLIRRINRGIINKIGDVFSKLVGDFVNFEKGQFVVKHGHHEITVPISLTSKE